MMIATYDITHKMDNLLKQELAEDKEFFKEYNKQTYVFKFHC
jgi:hypothetical protein